MFKQTCKEIILNNSTLVLLVFLLEIKTSIYFI